MKWSGVWSGWCGADGVGWMRCGVDGVGDI